MNKIIEFANYFLLIMLVMQTVLCIYDCLIGMICSTIIKNKFRMTEKAFAVTAITIILIYEFKFWIDIYNDIYDIRSAIGIFIILIGMKIYDDLLYKNLLKELKNKNIILKRK